MDFQINSFQSLIGGFIIYKLIKIWSSFIMYRKHRSSNLSRLGFFLVFISIFSYNSCNPCEAYYQQHPHPTGPQAIPSGEGGGETSHHSQQRGDQKSPYNFSAQKNTYILFYLLIPLYECVQWLKLYFYLFIPVCSLFVGYL